MAHLNLVMIHPFRDGNSRLARALQTLLLARDAVLDPIFSSIEEWLGHNTDDYYRILALTGQGAWNPDRATDLWVKFNLRAHHMQAQTLERRFSEADHTIAEILALVEAEGFPERVVDPPFSRGAGRALCMRTRSVWSSALRREICWGWQMQSSSRQGVPRGGVTMWLGP